MPAKSKSTKPRTRVQNLPKDAHELSGKEKKKVKGGLLPYVEQDNVRKSSNIQDGTSNTITKT